MSPESLDVIEALDTLYPPINPAVLLQAAREAYLSGDHRTMMRAIARLIEVEARNAPDSFCPGGVVNERTYKRIMDTAFSLSSLVWGL